MAPFARSGIGGFRIGSHVPFRDDDAAHAASVAHHLGARAGADGRSAAAPMASAPPPSKPRRFERTRRRAAAAPRRARCGQTKRVIPGIAIAPVGGASSHASRSGISTSLLASACSHVMRWPVYAAMRPISAINVLLHM